MDPIKPGSVGRFLLIIFRAHSGSNWPFGVLHARAQVPAFISGNAVYLAVSSWNLLVGHKSLIIKGMKGWGS